MRYGLKLGGFEDSVGGFKHGIEAQWLSTRLQLATIDWSRVRFTPVPSFCSFLW